MDPTELLSGRTRETAIRRDAQGRWFDGPDPITHVLLSRAFDSWIDVAEDGRYVLKNDINWAYVAIEGAPIFVRSVTIASDRTVTMQLSDGRAEALAPETLRQDREGALYAQVRDGKLAARFDPHAMMQLSPLITEDEGGIYLELGGAKLRPPVVDDPVRFEGRA